jgi:hypothetical protein
MTTINDKVAASALACVGKAIGDARKSAGGCARETRELRDGIRLVRVTITVIEDRSEHTATTAESTDAAKKHD